MGELLTILGIGLALEYLLGWAFTRRPVEPIEKAESPSWTSPVINIQEILPRYSGQRDFRVIAELGASPIEMEPHMPFSYGDSLPDDPSRIATGVDFHREGQTKTHAIWEVSYKFSPPGGFTSNNHEMQPVGVNTMKRVKESMQKSRAEAYYRDKFRGSPIANERSKRLNHND